MFIIKRHSTTKARERNQRFNPLLESPSFFFHLFDRQGSFSGLWPLLTQSDCEKGKAYVCPSEKSHRTLFLNLGVYENNPPRWFSLLVPSCITNFGLVEQTEFSFCKPQSDVKYFLSKSMNFWNCLLHRLSSFIFKFKYISNFIKKIIVTKMLQKQPITPVEGVSVTKTLQLHKKKKVLSVTLFSYLLYKDYYFVTKM